MVINPELHKQLYATAGHYTVLWYTLGQGEEVFVVWHNDDPSGEPFREIVVDNSPKGVETLRREFPINSQ